MGNTLAIVIELDADGAHPAAWRAAGHAPNTLLTGARIAQSARDAERAGFTAATFEDSPTAPGTQPNVTARLDAVQRAAFASSVTGALGLIPVVHAVYSEPFHVATQLSSLDSASDGRAGWVVGVNADPRIAARYGRTAVTAAQAARDASDVIEVARRLWDSWEDDAVIRDTATGRYLDRDKLHYADFVGDAFSIKGPAIGPRPPQGQLVVFAAADSLTNSAGRADTDVDLLSAGGGIADPAALEAAIRSAVHVRHAVSQRTVVELEVALDAAGLDAAERIAVLDEHTGWQPNDRARYVGSASGLVQLLSALASVVDGVRLRPAVLDIDANEIGRSVLPELRRNGVFTSPRVGDTLRDSFALAKPANRYAEVA